MILIDTDAVGPGREAIPEVLLVYGRKPSFDISPLFEVTFGQKLSKLAEKLASKILQKKSR